jgi:hypothetical protein
MKKGLNEAPALFSEELEVYGLPKEGAELIKNENGVIVARVPFAGGTAILKCFENPDFCREIENYSILRSLGVPTIAVYGSSVRSILLEDISASPDYRLAKEADMNDSAVVKALAKWYRELHTRGEGYVRENGAGMYCETDCLTKENLEAVGTRFGLEGSNGLAAAISALPKLKKLCGDAPKTLTYNDFYYTNLAVARERSAALMFDFNLLGKGVYVSDLKNVAYQLLEDNKRLFFAEYGGADKSLLLLDEITSPLVSLISAMQRDIYPFWAREAAEKLEELPALLERL